jgi:hypothetical protein
MPTVSAEFSSGGFERNKKTGSIKFTFTVKLPIEANGEEMMLAQQGGDLALYCNEKKVPVKLHQITLQANGNSKHATMFIPLDMLRAKGLHGDDLVLNEFTLEYSIDTLLFEKHEMIDAKETADTGVDDRSEAQRLADEAAAEEAANAIQNKSNKPKSIKRKPPLGGEARA